MDEKLEQMKQTYMDIPIPAELDFIVNQAINQHRKKPRTNLKWMTAIAAAAIVFVAGLNTSPAFAHSLADMPVVGKLIKVLTFREYLYDDGTHQAKVEVPIITNLENKVLEESLNTKYLEESRKLYTDFMIDIEKMKASGLEGHLGVDSGYIVKTDNDQIFAVGRYVVNTAASSSTTFQYDTIDKKNQLLITLPSLFKDEGYVQVISDYIKAQMKQRMKEDPTKIYWVEGVPNAVKFYFSSIKKNQSFYINKDGKLVIVFQKYEVTPGYMGTPEFIIPTNLLVDQLSTHAYLLPE
ncbi:Anti-sigma-V factor RsiV [Paenibacillus allorhizoplanae]|uniref:Anti-sigma-V factor RsiV n=1 Tax=Paenibacillus allorhizoplanae TaxID=2905648 RepID=A0ABN8GBN2_9BACL|nr:RsiV family protein [Paenibacillus allorhizoplanae]CAH1203573.1 Anti-sigma-V factor RsiV [Paenibacillus allorhizoplanae]